MDNSASVIALLKAPAGARSGRGVSLGKPCIIDSALRVVMVAAKHSLKVVDQHQIGAIAP
jgi:hypothetical protein